MNIKNCITESELWFHFEMGIVSDHVSPHLNEFTAIFKYLSHSHIPTHILLILCAIEFCSHS